MTRKLDILVTGAAGFLGSNLVDRLLADGHTVIGLDNLQTGSRKNLSHLEHEPRFSFLEADVRDPLDLPVNAIFNLACPASPPRYQIDPVQTILTNVLGAHNLLKLAARNNARILQASTSEVYGDPAITPQPETYKGNVSCIGPRACYDEGKRCAEAMFFDHNRMYGTDIKVIRIFNTYGPRMAMDDGRVISNFIVQALQNQDITIYGNGQQTRSFCYCSDLIEGMLKMMRCENFLGPVNLGNPGEFTILELAEKVLALTGSSSKLVFKPLPVDDPRQRKPDISLARQMLDWQPEIDLEDGLKRTIAYFRNILKDTIQKDELKS